MKVLVTGGAGFIGSHLVDAYLKKGDQVVIVDDLSSGTKANVKGALEKGAQLYETSILKNEIFEIVKKEQPDLINHHAAQKSVRDSVENPKNDAEINILGLLNVLEAARASSCRRIIFASSGGVVYGDQEKFPATESHPKRPVSPYGVSKYTSELYLDYYAKQWGFSSIALRYANIFGPRQDPEGEAGVVAIFCKRMLKNEDTLIFGSGEQTRDFVFVEDVVAANLAVENIKVEGFGAWNVGTAQETSVKALHQILSQTSGYKKTSRMEPAKSGEQLRSVLSYESLQRATDWKPHFSIETGLKKTFDWFRDYS